MINEDRTMEGNAPVICKYAPFNLLLSRAGLWLSAGPRSAGLLAGGGVGGGRGSGYKRLVH